MRYFGFSQTHAETMVHFQQAADKCSDLCFILQSTSFAFLTMCLRGEKAMIYIILRVASYNEWSEPHRGLASRGYGV